MKDMKVLFIDNFDSFTYNLVDEFEKRNCAVLVYRNNISLTQLRGIINDFKPNLLVISPGPGSPKEAGCCLDLITHYQGKLPIFGVCLGHQCIIEALGGVVSKAQETVHGKPSKIFHDGKTIFKNLDNPLQAGRYHSLAGTKIPDLLEISAHSPDEKVMAVRHKKYFLEGVQFHPESILTTLGGKIIENLINLCGGKKND